MTSPFNVKRVFMAALNLRGQWFNRKRKKSLRYKFPLVTLPHTISACVQYKKI